MPLSTARRSRPAKTSLRTSQSVGARPRRNRRHRSIRSSNWRGACRFAPQPSPPYHDNAEGQGGALKVDLCAGSSQRAEWKDIDDLNEQLERGWPRTCPDELAGTWRARIEHLVSKRFRGRTATSVPLPQHPMSTDLIQPARQGRRRMSASTSTTGYVQPRARAYRLIHVADDGGLTTRAPKLPDATEATTSGRVYEDYQRIAELARVKRHAHELTTAIACNRVSHRQPIHRRTRPSRRGALVRDAAALGAAGPLRRRTRRCHDRCARPRTLRRPRSRTCSTSGHVVTNGAPVDVMLPMTHVGRALRHSLDDNLSGDSDDDR